MSCDSNGKLRFHSKFRSEYLSHKTNVKSTTIDTNLFFPPMHLRTKRVSQSTSYVNYHWFLSFIFDHAPDDLSNNWPPYRDNWILKRRLSESRRLPFFLDFHSISPSIEEKEERGHYAFLSPAVRYFMERGSRYYTKVKLRASFHFSSTTSRRKAAGKELRRSQYRDIGSRSRFKERVPLKWSTLCTTVGCCVGTRVISRCFRERSRCKERETRNDDTVGLARAWPANYNVIAAINEQFQGASVRSVAGDINSKRIT